MVSTSGSSGTLDFSPGDVTSPGLAFKGDLFGRLPAGPRGERDRSSESRDTEDTAAGGAQAAIGIAECTRMEDDHVFIELTRCGEADRDAFLRVLGIAARGQHGRDRDRKSTRLNSSHATLSRMPSS